MPTETTLFSAAWRYRWLVVSATVLGLALGLAYARIYPPAVTYTARASLVVQATTTGLDLGTSGNPQRFVANQVEILRSDAVAQLASDIASAGEPAIALTAEQLSGDMSVSSSSNSDLVEVFFSSTDPVAATTGANALVSAYEQLLSSEKQLKTQAALERINVQLSTFDKRADDLAAEIADAQAKDPIRPVLRAQYEDALAEIVDLQSEAHTADETRIVEIRTRLGDLRTLISMYQSVRNIGQDDPNLRALQDEENQVLARKAALLERSDGISIDAELAPDIVAFQSSAQVATPSGGSGPGRAAAGGLVAGLLAGVGLASVLAARRRSLQDRMEPQPILGAPLLAEIPSFSEEGLKTKIPVRDAPRSASAEAFRFAATSIELRMHNQGVKTLAVLSATVGAGKSTVLANTALAAAREGNRVLIVDADFGNQALTALLTGDEEWLPRGLTDVVGGGLPLDDVIATIGGGSDAQLFLLSRGRHPVAAADLVGAPEMQELFETMREHFDMVFVDAPPLLQVAYASTLASYGDAVLMVVEQKGSTLQLQEARSRLDLIGTPLLGYLYNRATLRRDMTHTEGSMADVLGDRGMLGAKGGENSPPTQKSRWRL